MNRLTSILATDKAGNPRKWLSVEDAIHLLVTEKVIAPIGQESRIVFGGINQRDGHRSQIEVNSILLTSARVMPRLWREDYTPPLTNRALHKRDRFICLYCGIKYPPSKLTRDHVIPTSRGGEDTFNNTVSACKQCNSSKRDRTPEEWGVSLIALPYTPCFAEHLLLQGRNVLVDQFAFIESRVKKKK